MKKHHSLAFYGALTSALLIGCDGELELSQINETGKPNTNAMSMRMPQSLQASDPANGSDLANNTKDTQTNVKEAVENVEAVAATLDGSTAGGSSAALYLGAELLTDRVEFAQQTLADIDHVWEDIITYCASVAKGTECQIPAGTLSDDDTEQVGVITYQSNPDDKYAHSVVRTLESDFTESEQIRWNEDRSLIAMSFDSSWQDDDGTGKQSSHLLYSESSDGDQISLRDQFTLGDSSFTDYQQLHQLNDGLNGIEIKTEFNWNEAYSSGSWHSHAVANNEGGKLGTTATFDDEDSVWHSRETFDKDGDLASSEHCEQTNGTDCTDAANWTDAEITSETLPVDFNIDGTETDLENAFLKACGDLDLPDDDCGFSETEMVTLNGAYDIYENTDDVKVYLCVETGEDELSCRRIAMTEPTT